MNISPTFTEEPPFEGAIQLAFAEGRLPSGLLYVAQVHVPHADVAPWLLENVQLMVEEKGGVVGRSGFYWTEQLEADEEE